MTRDDNKGIETIKYNHLNLPTEIIFVGDNRKINYLYTATGQKLRKIVNEGIALSITDYLGGYQYNNNVLQFFPTAEGYVKNTVLNGANSYDYVFNYTDHLGNVRLNYGLVAGVLTKFEENNYYPFGLKHKNYNYNLKEIQEVKELKITQEAKPEEGIPEIKEMVFDKKSLLKEEEYFEKMAAIKNEDPIKIIGFIPNSGYQYKYNGKEYQDELSLNMYAMDARQCDPALGRWVALDPIDHYDMSPYCAFNNNPVLFADPSGMEGALSQLANYSSDCFAKWGQAYDDHATAMREQMNQKQDNKEVKKNNTVTAGPVEEGDGPGDPPSWWEEFLKSVFSFHQKGPKAYEEATENRIVLNDALKEGIRVGKPMLAGTAAVGALPLIIHSGVAALGTQGVTAVEMAEGRGILTITNQSASKIHAVLNSGRASEFYQILNPGWRGAMTEVDALYSTTSFTAQNGIRATLSTTSGSIGMATIKLAQKGFEIILRFPHF
jgi:RHS repeat-associated protein